MQDNSWLSQTALKVLQDIQHPCPHLLNASSTAQCLPQPELLPHMAKMSPGGSAAPMENHLCSLILLFYRKENGGPKWLNDWSQVARLGRGRKRGSSSESCPELYSRMLYSFPLLPGLFGKWKVKLKFS